MGMEILKSYETVAAYIEKVCGFADKYKNELGFLPHSVYEEQAAKGRLWVAVDSVTREFLGHLMFGGVFPALKVTQMFVHPSCRGKNYASKLIEALANYGEANEYLTITARVAEDLPANSFWEKSDFRIKQKKPGGKTTNRIINVRCRDLNTPSLFTLMGVVENKKSDSENIFVKNKIRSSTPYYAIDLNVLFDLIRDRGLKDEASAVISAGLANKVRLCVTDEFLNELQRNSKGLEGDPVFEFSKQLPILRNVDGPKTDTLLPDLRAIVFPGRKLDGKKAKQDNSDIRHLAKCIANNVDGFVTRERAILRASSLIFEMYGLEVVPPADFIEPSFEEGNNKTTVLERFTNKKIDTSSVTEDELDELRSFVGNIDVNEHFDAAFWSPQTSGNESRKLLVRVDNKIVGVASWKAPTKIRKSAVLHMHVDEDHPSFEKIVDHIFEIIFRNANDIEMFRLSLNVGMGQTRTKALALQKGFRSTTGYSALKSNRSLVKIVCSDMVTPKKWKVFVHKFKSLTGLSLPLEMPLYQGGKYPWITAEDSSSGRKREMTLFEFETLLSPALFLCPDRNGIVVPIQHSYAVEIGIVSPKQLGLLPGKEALLHSERAYFRASTKLNDYSKGMPVIFYVSREGEMSQRVVGCARITYSGVHSAEEIENKFSRQGVLPLDTIRQIGLKNGVVHVITFDNFNSFNRPATHKQLKLSGYISGANLVTAEPKLGNQISEIVSMSMVEERSE